MNTIFAGNSNGPEISRILSKISQRIGNEAKALWRIEGLMVPVKVLDARKVWNRIDCHIQPVNGTGTKWVDLDKLEGFSSLLD